MANPLNTQYNKTTYGVLSTAGFVFLAALSTQFHWSIEPELWAATQGLAQAIITFAVPNKEV